MTGVTPTPAAVLAQGHAIGVVALALIRLIVAMLALLACEGDSDANVSAGHSEFCAPCADRRSGHRARAKKNPAQARGIRQSSVLSPRGRLDGNASHGEVLSDSREPCRSGRTPAPARP